MTDDIEIREGSGNVFRDLGLPDPDTKHMKAKLAAAIIAALDRRKLTQMEAAKLVGLQQADISRIRNADLRRFTIDRLVKVLNRLDRRVDVTVREARGEQAA